MSDCIFCKIISGEIPSKKLYEDDLCYAFYDIASQSDVHFLVVPKEHISCAKEINGGNSSVISHIFEVIARLASELKLDSYRIINNCGEGAGQTVMHLHFHVLSGKNLGERLV
ncbi:MAG: histidine triad nucleotide-binding protein [Ruminococcus sp.]|nr:histidine triad nucleotide-binding protein [Ruminococcus sp.]